jgi:hypothetical protein
VCAGGQGPHSGILTEGCGREGGGGHLIRDATKGA